MEPNPSQDPSHESARLALEALVVDNQDLERLEDLLDPFNVFEALGAINSELRHSDFLSFLLSPKQSHGLGDLFVTRFLQRVLQTPGASFEISAIDADVWDLNTIEVRREWQGIDILLLDADHEFAVIVENKIHSSEHSNQLQRYWNAIEESFPGWRIIGVYLTLGAEEPSDGRYVSVGYETICSLVEAIVETRSTSLSQDIRMTLLHYTQMLRRHFLEDTEIADLARRIYQKHQKALDLILEHRPDRQAQVGEILLNLVRKEPSLLVDNASKSYIQVVHKDWTTSRFLNEGHGWTRSGRMLMFEITNEPARVVVRLTIGPGPVETRRRLFEAALKKQPPFKPSQSSLARMWNSILQRTLLTGASLDEDIEQTALQLEKAWNNFMTKDVPPVVQAISEERWLWEEAPLPAPVDGETNSNRDA